MAKKWWVLASVACGTFMATLDSSIVNIALPTLTKALGTDLNKIKWVVIVYLLIITCLLLPFGKLSDQIGRKTVFLSGFLIFILGSVFCSLSGGLAFLVLFRAMQAIGASMLMVNGPAIITACFPSSQRGAALGILAMVVSAGLISGPGLGGILISNFGWKSIFALNVPIGLIGIFLVYHFVPSEACTEKPTSFDWVGTILQIVCLVAFIILFDPPNISISGGIPFVFPRWLLLLILFIFGAMFVKVESESRVPLLDLSLLQDRSFWTANLASFFTFVSYSIVTVLMPFYMDEVKNYSAEKIGLLMTAIPFSILIIAPLSGRLSDKIGSQKLCVLGAMVSALGLLKMAGLFGIGITQGSSESELIIALALVGISLGLFQSPNNNTIMGSVPGHKLGVASALLATVRNLGFVTGTGLASLLFLWQRQMSGNYIKALQFTFIVAAIVSLGAIGATVLCRPPGAIEENPNS